MRGLRAVVGFLNRGAMVMALVAIGMRMALGRRAFVMPRDHALRCDDRCQPLDGHHRRQEHKRKYPEDFPHRRLLYVSYFEQRTRSQFPGWPI